MQHYWSLEDVHLRDVWLTIGSFDGVHKGHQEIVRKLTAGAHADNVLAVVLAFYPHPAVILRDRRGAYYLTSPEERADLLGQMGVDVVITHPFNRGVAEMSAYDFVAGLKRHLGFRNLYVGHDFALGRNREGEIPTLRNLGDEFGFTLNVIQPVTLSEQVVSSSQIRGALSSGDVGRASQLLGRPFQLSGKVVPGDGRGQTLGIPTANLEVWPERLLPKAGVYACLAHIQAQSWQAVTNVGYRPTFDGNPDSPTVETHLLDFKADLYDQWISISFMQRLRAEERFPGVEALVTQIHRDIDQARGLLKPASRGSV